MSINKELFGKDSKGNEVYAYNITNSRGTLLRVIELGAAIQSLCVADRDGNMADVVLGYDNVEQYEKENDIYLGIVVGRNANRIKNGRFTIGGKEYQLEINDNDNNLHSGSDCYGFRRWDGAEVQNMDGEGVMFSLKSPDGDQGMPGNLDMSVTYILTEDNRVIIAYRGVADADTIVNPTNHSYFNLAGHASGDICGHIAWIDADNFTPSEAGLIPTGELRSVAGTPLDFTTPKPIGQDIESDYEPMAEPEGYDHNYILKTDGNLALVASLEEKTSGRYMEMYTQMPGLQFYTGNAMDDGRPGKDGVSYSRRGGVCLESQFVPDAINNSAFKSPLLKAGEKFEYVTVYKFSVK